MFEWPHGAPSSAVVSDFMEKLAQDGAPKIADRKSVV